MVGLGNGKIQLLFLRYPGLPYVSYLGASYELVDDDPNYKYWLPLSWLFFYLDDAVPSLDYLRNNVALINRQTWFNLETRLHELETIEKSGRNSRKSFE